MFKQIHKVHKAGESVPDDTEKRQSAIVILMGCSSQSCSGVQSFVSLDDYIGFC